MSHSATPARALRPDGAPPRSGSRPTVRSAVRAVDLTKTYGSGPATVHALDGVSLDLAAGHLTAIMGASGSGKSTLLHCLTGLDSPTSGTVWIGDTDITSLSDDDLTRLRRDRIGFVFQSFNLMPTLTAERNILLPLKLSRRRVDQEWFDRVTGMLGITERLSHRPSELSGGQQQRVAVARALITRPDVIVADEPTGALDSAASDSLLTFLRNCVEDLGQTVVMVTHDHHAAEYADRVVTLRDGRTSEDHWVSLRAGVLAEDGSTRPDGSGAAGSGATHGWRDAGCPACRDAAGLDAPDASAQDAAARNVGVAR
ncbi:Macrolide export ATP-binding/permease protein MacB [Acidipropionibacterium jensenii]|uniref:Macrolide export ATP-binding/permease protein MacB n=1 Tax=Acidipropionibacterium jensenii TaxID=1749 RepID=A0A3S5EVF1_9ACTN|nr:MULTISPECIES: ABC transporter ATP-binding protein [Acidipropionibacterium]MDN6811123.1 ABC transporter ATP-binding protein [Acidipropionibacterium jensenii]QCV87337.1 ABC transporter ATP-binding protein [Acidipropionibacterium jensenii]VEI04540.1 Macrolide export ATP-binding/permease protein MacB [Acidipropionibacterium jensenii]